MKSKVLKVARIGNSRGVRIPAATLERFRIGATVTMEERSDGILLRPQSEDPAKLSWEETALEMAGETESWSEWDGTSSDGLEGIVWKSPPAQRVAEDKTRYRRKISRPK